MREIVENTSKSWKTICVSTKRSQHGIKLQVTLISPHICESWPYFEQKLYKIVENCRSINSFVKISLWPQFLPIYAKSMLFLHINWWFSATLCYLCTFLPKDTLISNLTPYPPHICEIIDIYALFMHYLCTIYDDLGCCSRIYRFLHSFITARSSCIIISFPDVFLAYKKVRIIEA